MEALTAWGFIRLYLLVDSDVALIIPAFEIKGQLTGAQQSVQSYAHSLNHCSVFKALHSPCSPAAVNSQVPLLLCPPRGRVTFHEALRLVWGELSPEHMCEGSLGPARALALGSQQRSHTAPAPDKHVPYRRQVQSVPSHWQWETKEKGTKGYWENPCSQTNVCWKKAWQSV